MNKVCILISLLFGVSFGCLYEQRNAQGSFSSRAAHWSYEGESGPSHWASLDDTYKTCGAGTHQTPVDIAFDSNGATQEYHIGDLSFHGSTIHHASFDHNGHTVVVQGDLDHTVTGGAFFGDHYRLLQFHFHAPSEHTFNGVIYPLEVHFVHQNPATGDLAVIGVVFEMGTHNNTWLNDLFNHLPHFVEHKSEGEVEYDLSIDPYAAFPEDLSYYHYMGSLTTPPCTEGLKWFVLKQVQQVSQYQLDTWYEHVSPSNRPVQNLNGRTLFYSHPEEDNGEEPTPNPPSQGAETIINFNFAGMIPSY